jgi:DNA repair protein RadC
MSQVEERTVHRRADVFSLFEYSRKKKTEHVWVLTLNIRNGIIRKRLISKGTATSTTVNATEVFRPAILDRAMSIIVVHNHPSGSLIPSEIDKNLYEDLKKSGEVLGIWVTDFIICSSRGFLSLKE